MAALSWTRGSMCNAPIPPVRRRYC